MLKKLDKTPYISIRHMAGGWWATKYVWYESKMKGAFGTYTPSESGMEGHPTQRHAIVEAMLWADLEGIRYEGPDLTPTPEVNVVLIDGVTYIHCGHYKDRAILINVDGGILLFPANITFDVVQTLVPKNVGNYWYFSTGKYVFAAHTGARVRNTAILRCFK